MNGRLRQVAAIPQGVGEIEGRQRRAPPVADLAEQRQALFEQRGGTRSVALAMIGHGQTNQRAGGTPPVAGVAIEAEALREELTGAGKIPPIEGDAAQIVQRTRDLGATPYPSAQSQAFLIERFGSFEIAAFEGHDAEIVERRGDQELIANLPRQRQALLEQGRRLVVVATIEGHHAEVAEGARDPGLVAALSRQGQRLAMERFRAIVVALGLRQDPGAVERGSTRRRAAWTRRRPAPFRAARVPRRYGREATRNATTPRPMSPLVRHRPGCPANRVPLAGCRDRFRDGPTRRRPTVPADAVRPRSPAPGTTRRGSPSPARAPHWRPAARSRTPGWSGAWQSEDRPPHLDRPTPGGESDWYRGVRRGHRRPGAADRPPKPVTASAASRSSRRRTPPAVGRGSAALASRRS